MFFGVPGGGGGQPGGITIGMMTKFGLLHASAGLTWQLHHRMDSPSSCCLWQVCRTANVRGAFAGERGPFECDADRLGEEYGCQHASLGPTFLIFDTLLLT